MTEIIIEKKLYTTHATSTGGRNGHTQTDDKIVSFDLSIPKSMGGPGNPGATTPEDLFAAGYAACFGSACDHVAKNILKMNPTSTTIEATVTVGVDAAGGFALAVTLKASIGGLSQADANKLVATAHSICPYSRATKGNIKVELIVVNV